MPKLGVNVDHVATLRQARGGKIPNPCFAALEAIRGGAAGITIHLREDRRHIQDRDLIEIKKAIRVPLNLEMALAPEIVQIALRYSPEEVCIVPEKRKELTTEGGLDVFSSENTLKKVIPKFHKKKIIVSLFIEPSLKQIEASSRLEADAIEIHTGTYANAKGSEKRRELLRIQEAVRHAHRLGLKIHAGHGLDYENVQAIARIPEIRVLNIGHSIVSRAVFVGMRNAVAEMKQILTA